MNALRYAFFVNLCCFSELTIVGHLAENGRDKELKQLAFVHDSDKLTHLTTCWEQQVSL